MPSDKRAHELHSPWSDRHAPAVSIGASAICPDALHSPESLTVTADRALYAAKAKGRNRVVSLSCR